jgi:hypothetical protein
MLLQTASGQVEIPFERSRIDGTFRSVDPEADMLSLIEDDPKTMLSKQSA